MCRTIREQKLSYEEAMELVATAMERGTGAEHFDDLLDGLLGTTMPAVDAELDAKYEEEREARS